MIWRTYLILAPADLDLEQWGTDSTGGAAVLCRDVLTGPPGYYIEDFGAPDGLGAYVERDTWPDGVHSPAPGLALATGAAFGKRPGVQGRLGARIYYARLTGDALAWLGQAPAVAAGVQLAAASDLWGAPELVLVLRDEDPGIRGALESVLPGVPQRYIPTGLVSPQTCAAAIAGAVP